MPIRIRGASEHNLRDVDVTFSNGLTVVTGVSGSGKTSLVFDTLYQEARRRFLEVLNLGSVERPAPPRVRSITGLGPAVAVGQNLLNRNPSSTVATASGLHPFFRLLYANLGERHCAHCNAAVSVLSEDELVARLVAWSGAGPQDVLAPLLRGAQGSHRTLLAALEAELGCAALLVDGVPYRGAPLEPAAPHDIDVAVTRLNGPATARQAREAVRAAEALGAHALVVDRGTRRDTLSRAPVCAACGAWFGDLTPAMFHTPCAHCDGRGCERCEGTGLHPEAAGVRWQGMRLPELLALPVEDALARLAEAEFGAAGARLRVEIARRLEALDRVGLGYVALDRPAPTLSRGEAQRLRLAVALTGRLEDMLYILDEPTIGQHPADVMRLLPTFRDLGGPVIYVEHDRVAAAAADHAIDLGPGAGNQGGRVLYSGTPAGLWRADTPTGRYFSLRQPVATPAPRPAPAHFLTLRRCHLRNLQDLDVAIPLGRLTAITGVSGSGKSTLVEDVLVASLAAGEPRGCRAVEGPPLKPTIVDQDPIGNNPRSNPATYTKLADVIRDCFAAATGLSAAHFSFNRPEGACPDCSGMGAIEVRMRYLPSTWITCQGCGGERFSEEVLAARVSFDGRSLSIAEFYDLSIAEAMPLLLAHESLPIGARRRAEGILGALNDVGLGYLSLGQSSPTLSGGEAQRVKLAKYLGARSLAGQLLVLDEPTTGLHPQDVAGLLVVLDRLARAGATIVVVEHNADVIRAADWVIDLGPGAGPRGGRLLYAGPSAGLEACEESLTGRALRDEAHVVPRDAMNHGDTEGLTAETTEGAEDPSSLGATHPKPMDTDSDLSPWSPCLRGSSSLISIRNARAHNLRGVDVDIPKGALTVITGVSGSGKSSLVGDVLEAEARRRFLESLSLYERQSTREGPEAPVDAVTGLGVAVTVSPERRLRDRRATVGSATEIGHHLAVLLSWAGQRRCTACGRTMVRGNVWRCPACGAEASIPGPGRFSSRNYAAACTRCNGVGTLQEPRPEKLIIHPERPLCDGAMYSPGFFPKGYLGKPYNGGYDMVQALAERYGFDPFRTPWNAMAPEAQHAFLFGTEEPLQVTFRSRTGRVRTGKHRFPGFYGWIGDWDVGGTYTAAVRCPECGGARLRPKVLAVTLGGHNVHALSEMPLRDLAAVLDSVEVPEREEDLAGASLSIARRRLGFLVRVGLGYLHLNRPASTLSAGEAQRLKLAGLLGSGLTSLTVLVDEPTRGLHPREVDALVAALRDLRGGRDDRGDPVGHDRNTVIVVEHDPAVIAAADHIVDMGPGAGALGGAIVAQGPPERVRAAATITGAWLRGERRADVHRPRRRPQGWLAIRGARGNNLRVPEARIPLEVLVGVCGVSGSGKSTLIIDTLGRAVAPRRQTTSVAYAPVDPEPHDGIDGAPARAIVVDQSRAGLVSAASYLDLTGAIHTLYAETPDARALGLDAKGLAQRCSVCRGSGALTLDMGFLPDVHSPCDACRGSGYRSEAWHVRLRGVALPEVFGRTIDQAHDLLGDDPALARPLAAARRVGLGYLVLRQPGYELSGGEAQRLKIARELCRAVTPHTLYILDEPTVGQHLEDVARLTRVLHDLVAVGHSVLVVEHHPHLLAACDWLIELGPGGGPDGGRIVAAGGPEALATGDSPTAPYLAQVLGITS